ncbi:MAG TPA: SDR family oxidoreductase [Candidatus Kapabacteria bacterium]|nr:SDR family oxidoreductase [Candidatus Kapabacteria bacterium]
MNEKPVVWITGASKGIGKAIAEAFADNGAIVVLSSRKKAALVSALKNIADRGGKGGAIVCDVTDEKSVGRAVKEIERKFGKVDVLVNNAGIAPVTAFTKTTLAKFDETLAINLRGTFVCSQAVTPGMIERGSGAIVNILSTAAIRAFSGNAAYCASKFGALGLTRVMRTELKKYGIRVIGVLPGAVETDMWGVAERKQSHDRMLQPEDVAKVVHDAIMLHPRAVVEEILLRPLGGDL